MIEFMFPMMDKIGPEHQQNGLELIGVPLPMETVVLF
jgi:hypothetical protein